MDHGLQQPVLGIDLGTSSSKVAYIKNQGMLEIVQNEVNNRTTPTVVGFTARQRLGGDGAQSLIKSNLKNTVRYFKHVMCRKYSDTDSSISNEEFWSLAKIKKSEKGDDCVYEVQYQGVTAEYSTLQICGMYLSKIREIAIKWCDFHGGGNEKNNGITDNKKLNVVMSCPAYYDDLQRRALVDAASLAGMQTLRIISDGAAAAISYGPYRVDDFANKDETFVAFCSCGHSCFTVAIARFMADGLQLIAEICDQHLGARDMDLVLMKHFSAEFQAKNKGAGDPMKNKKSMLKLEEAVQKTKKVLSSNDQAPINVECLIEDYDYSSSVSRDQFEELCEPLIERYRTLIRNALARAHIDTAQLEYVEMIGGTMRVPWVKRICQEEFNKEQLSTTLNADESVARGCALQAAIYSPLYKVRDYNIWIYSQRSVSIAWSSNGEEPQKIEVFPMLTPLNLIKVLTCYRPTNFVINAYYTDDPSINIGSYTVAVNNPDKHKVQVHAKLDVNSIFSLENPQLFDADGVNPQSLEFESIHLPGPTEEDMKQLKQAELQMLEQTEMVVLLENMRNDLETLLYRQRDKISSGAGLEKVPADKKEKHSKLLQEAEDWLYDTEDSCTLDEVREKIDLLKDQYAKLEK